MKPTFDIPEAFHCISRLKALDAQIVSMEQLAASIIHSSNDVELSLRFCNATETERNQGKEIKQERISYHDFFERLRNSMVHSQHTHPIGLMVVDDTPSIHFKCFFNPTLTLRILQLIIDDSIATRFELINSLEGIIHITSPENLQSNED